MPFHPAFALGVVLAAGTAQPKLTLVDAVRAALERNPELAEARASAAASAAVGAVARALPEPTLSYQAWQQPLARPWDPTATNMHMIGVRQSLPFFGQRRLAGQSADLEAKASGEDASARRLAVEAQVAHALTTWWRQQQELAVHLQHMELAGRTAEATRLRYATGSARQGDVLRAETDHHRLHVDIAGIREQLRAGQAMLNALMGRGPSQPLLPPDEPEQVAPQAQAERPEIAAAKTRSSRAAVDRELAHRAKSWPDVMVGFDYMLMPQAPDAFAVMVQVSAPWLWGKRRPEAERASLEAIRAQTSIAATENAAAFENAEAGARVEAAKAQLTVLRDDVLPRSERAVEALRTSYVTGQGDLVSLIDAERSLLDTRLAVVRQRAALGDAIADLRRARGLDLIPSDKP